MINALRGGGRLLSETIQRGKSRIMYREKEGENCILALLSFSLFFREERTWKKSRIITMHLRVTVWIHIHMYLPERTRSKSEQFEESIPTGFIPTDRFLEFCDSSFLEDDRYPSEYLACPSDSSRSVSSSVSIRIIAKYSTATNRGRLGSLSSPALGACDAPLNRGGRRLRKSLKSGGTRMEAAMKRGLIPRVHETERNNREKEDH